MSKRAISHNRSQAASDKQLYTEIHSILNESQIKLIITRKRVKNINFRLKPNQLLVSAPNYISDEDLIVVLSKRLNWVIDQHATILKRLKYQGQTSDADLNSPQPVKLWGESQGLIMDDEQRIAYYRNQLQNVMPELFQKWQPIVGKIAKQTRIKKMSTRWGSCNIRARRVWLSVYLPAYPLQCTEYVIVHELCHLHQANHSPAFWYEVKRSMPDYKQWHDMLAGKSGVVD
ncbi:YgjP-like metallopeptidase domain-containing protein [Psychrobacter sp.]|uniref:M48 family metallopeptidase n=1 Tax=Psychrobacter sp. TaxID=56811 RepID=UPI0025D67DDD|nr:YgjP-like metallopeptidase domain-containing protein [Psychrobacter sp.]